jgi:hypothetical protein
MQTRRSARLAAAAGSTVGNAQSHGMHGHQPPPSASSTVTIDLTGEDDADETEGDGVGTSTPTNGVVSPVYGEVIPRGYCPRCDGELIESAVLVSNDDNGIRQDRTMDKSSRAAPHLATAAEYCALVQCACCRRSFVESDEEAFSYLQRTRSSRFRRCRSCEGASFMDLYQAVVALNSAHDVIAQLQEAGMAAVDRMFAMDRGFYGDEQAEETESFKALQTTSRIFRHAFGLEYRRSWLQHEAPADDLLYTPQLGDDVMYFPEAYNDFLQECFSAWTLTCRPDYWTDPHRQVIDRSFAVKCRVVGIRYVFPEADSYVKCRIVMPELTLAVLAVSSTEQPSQKRKRQQLDEPAHVFDLVEPKFGQFVTVDSTMTILRRESQPAVRYKMKALCHPKYVENYLVLDAKYEIGVRSQWDIGDRVQSPLINLWGDCEPMNTEQFVGTIVGIEPRPVIYYGTQTNAKTPALSVKVNWDGQEEAEASGTWEILQQVSPWDLQFVDEHRQHLQTWQEECCSATHRRNARGISDEGKQELLSAIDHLMAQQSFRYFVRLSIESEDAMTASPVSLPHQPDYLSDVANPMDLTKIRARVMNGYYRQRESLLGDVMVMCANTKEYERSTSGHVAMADMLLAATKQVVDAVWPSTVSHGSVTVDETARARTERYVYHANRVLGPPAAAEPRQRLEQETATDVEMRTREQGSSVDTNSDERRMKPECEPHLDQEVTADVGMRTHEQESSADTNTSVKRLKHE